MYADLHCDTLYECFVGNTDLNDENLHITAKRLAGLTHAIQVFAHYIPEKENDKYGFFRRMLENSLRIIDDTPQLLLFRSKGDIELAERENRVLAVLSVENGDFFNGDRLRDTERVRFLEQNGIRFLSLCYNNGSEICGGAMSDGGLSPIGLRAAYMLAEHGIVSDISHLNEKSALALLDADICCVATHSNCAALCPHPRNIGDKIIERLIYRRSLMGINLYSPFLNDGKHAKAADVYAHISHVTDMGGAGILALGADFDGCDSLPAEINNVADIKNLDIPHETIYNNVKRFLKGL